MRHRSPSPCLCPEPILQPFRDLNVEASSERSISYSELEARQAAQLLYLNRAKINRFYQRIRECIALLCGSESLFKNGNCVQRKFFRIRGKRGRGMQGNTPAFGMLKRGDKVYRGRTNTHRYKAYDEIRFAPRECVVPHRKRSAVAPVTAPAYNPRRFRPLRPCVRRRSYRTVDSVLPSRVEALD